MPEPSEPAKTPTFPCQFCGGAMILVHSSDADEVGPRVMTFECTAGHRVVVERVETYEDDDADADV